MAVLNDVLLLNAEIAAMVRAGIPLELGLRRLSQTVSGRLGELAERLVVRLEQGDSLVTAIRAEETLVSPLYAAVVEAGLRADRLPAALDGLVTFGRTLQETRRRVQLALLYPAIVAVIAWVLLLLFVAVLAPAVVEAWDPLSTGRAYWLPLLLQAQTSVLWWGPGIPLAVVLLLYLLSALGRSWSDTEFIGREPGGRGMMSGTWIPGVPGIYRDLDRANVARMLGLLLEHQVPLPQALELVSRMAGGARLKSALNQIATGIGQGNALSDEIRRNPELPLLLAQLLRSGVVDHNLPAAMSQAGDIYLRRVDRRVTWLRTVLVPVFAVLIGGGVSLAYALALGLPLRWFLTGLLTQS